MRQRLKQRKQVKQRLLIRNACGFDSNGLPSLPGNFFTEEVGCFFFWVNFSNEIYCYLQLVFRIEKFSF